MVRLEFLAGMKLPKDGPELCLQLQHAARKKAPDGVAGFGQHPAMSRKARRLEREHEIIRRLGRPFAKALAFLRAVEGAVDLDRGDLAAGVLELARLRQPLRIELAPPRLEHPAADADSDHCHLSGVIPEAAKRPSAIHHDRMGRFLGYRTTSAAVVWFQAARTLYLGSGHSYLGNTAARSFAPCNRASSSILELVSASSFDTTLARLAIGLRS